MQLGVIGLGRMGGNMVKRLRADGHEVIGFDLSPQSGRDVDSLEALVSALTAPRVVWIMVPAARQPMQPSISLPSCSKRAIW